MDSAACNMLGNVSNASSLAVLAFQGAASLTYGYQTIYSPHTTLQNTWDALRSIKTHLETINPARRQRIEDAAAQRKCRSLEDIEKEFQDLWLAHTELCQTYEQSSHFQRHISRTLRSLINALDADVKALLNDTRTTTRAQAFIPSSPPLPPPPLPPSLGDLGDSMDISLAGQARSPSIPEANREYIEMNAV